MAISNIRTYVFAFVAGNLASRPLLASLSSVWSWSLIARILVLCAGLLLLAPASVVFFIFCGMVTATYGVELVTASLRHSVTLSAFMSTVALLVILLVVFVTVSKLETNTVS
jgi:hypothetical protein